MSNHRRHILLHPAHTNTHGGARANSADEYYCNVATPFCPTRTSNTEMFDDDSGATYYTMPGTAAVAWTRPASLDLKDPTTMAEVELRALINQAGWDDDSVDGIELLALGQAARAAIAEQEVAATYDDANASGDAGDAPHDDEDEGANVKNDWNEDGAADEKKTQPLTILNVQRATNCLKVALTRTRTATTSTIRQRGSRTLRTG